MPVRATKSIRKPTKSQRPKEDIRSSSVFINCPFDDSYEPIFRAMLFTIYDLGLIPRCALEFDDAGEVRLVKITRLIQECPYAIHDISAVEPDKKSHLPRFNMPFELGLDLGCRFFGDTTQRKKICLILDSVRYRFQKFLSDIAGQDIKEHRDKPEYVIEKVRDWLVSVSKKKGLPGGSEIARRYLRFQNELPAICKKLKREPKKLAF